jgi:hypothetical protein
VVRRGRGPACSRTALAFRAWPHAHPVAPPPPHPHRGQAHCTEGPSAGEFTGVPGVMWREAEDQLKLRLSIGYTTSFSGGEVYRGSLARDGVLSAAAAALAAAGATYTVPAVPAPIRPKVE